MESGSYVWLKTISLMRETNACVGGELKNCHRYCEKNKSEFCPVFLINGVLGLDKTRDTSQPRVIIEHHKKEMNDKRL